MFVVKSPNPKEYWLETQYTNSWKARTKAEWAGIDAGMFLLIEGFDDVLTVKFNTYWIIKKTKATTIPNLALVKNTWMKKLWIIKRISKRIKVMKTIPAFTYPKEAQKMIVHIICIIK